MHPNEFKMTHLVRRVSDSEVRLLANLLPRILPGALLDCAAGASPWPHSVFELYWPRTQAGSFAPLS